MSIICTETVAIRSVDHRIRVRLDVHQRINIWSTGVTTETVEAAGTPLQPVILSPLY